ncbi:MAG: glutamate racemase [Bacteroidales bacterium]
MDKKPGPIGVFDSGYGGLTVLSDFLTLLPEYDYYYLGDNARSPYGSRSFDTVYTYTLQAVKKLFEMGCQLVILACNTASAKALRTIQQNDLPLIDPSRRVLGVIRPSVEAIGEYTKTNTVGILGTAGTVASNSYPLELAKIYPQIHVLQEACPMWVPLVENNEHNSEGADFFIKKNIQNLVNRNNKIDTVILGCTHYPLLYAKIKKYIPENIKIVSQGKIVAESLRNYLQRHPEMEVKCSKNRIRNFFTTESTELFMERARIFCNDIQSVSHVEL